MRDTSINTIPTMPMMNKIAFMKSEEDLITPIRGPIISPIQYYTLMENIRRDERLQDH